MLVDTQHQFHARESDWGFTSFMSLSELYDPNKGFLVNDTCIIEADVAVRKVVDYWTYDSKKETGYVGLKNQGATCYMNSLLQTLYHIPYFRKVGCVIQHLSQFFFASLEDLSLIIIFIRLFIICQQQRTTCHQEAFLLLYRVCSTSFNIMIPVLQPKN